MSQRRPPEDEADLDKAEADRAAGLRSQGRPAPGDWGKTRPLDSEGLGRPTPMRPEPGRAFAGGQPGRGTAGEEPTVRVARSLFTGVDPNAGNDEVTRAAPRPQPAAVAPRTGQPAASADRTHLLGGAAQVPASRQPAPAPASYPSNRNSAKATLLMTDTGPKAAAQPPAGRVDPTARQPASGGAQVPSGVSAGRHPGATLSVDEADLRASTGASAAAHKAARAGAIKTAPVPQHAGDEDSLRLQLDAGDMLEQPVDMAPPDGPKRGPGLLIAVVLAVLVVGGGVWYGMSGSRDEPTAEVPATRNDMQPAETAPGAEPTAVPAAAPIAGQAAPGTAAPATAPAKTAVPAAAPAATAAAAGDDDDDNNKAATPATPGKKADARARAKRRKAGAAAAPVSDDVAAAREALRNLQTGGPVLKVQPSEEPIPAPDEGSDMAPPAPPEPPPPDPEE
jgi:hypothetical protein